MTPEEFRKYGHAVIDWIADYRARVEERPVMSQAEPGQVKASLPPHPPEDPESFDAILRDLDSVVMPGISHWQHPRFFGYFPSNGSLGSVLGDYVSTGLGVIGLAWQSSPALSELEEVVTGWLRQMVGLSPAWDGVIQDTASTSTLLALLCARERRTNYGLVRGGLQAEPKPLVVYTSAQAHSSVEKAALLAGFGRENVRMVACDERYAMRSDALAAAIADGRGGRTGAVRGGGHHRHHHDDGDRSGGRDRAGRGRHRHLAARRCRDGRLGDGAARVPLDVGGRRGRRLGGAESAQVARRGLRLLGLLRARRRASGPGDVDQSRATCRPPPTAVVKNYRDWGIPLGRRFRALKLWFLIREQGVRGLQARLRRDLDNTRWLAGQVSNTPGLAGAGPGAAADAVRAARAAGADRRGAGPAHADVV